MRSRWTAPAWAILLLAGPVRAEEPPPRPTPADPLAEARRDFPSVQAARTAAPEAKDAAPRVPVPEMLALEGVNGGRAPLAPGHPPGSPPKKSSPHWLSDDEPAALSAATGLAAAPTPAPDGAALRRPVRPEDLRRAALRSTAEDPGPPAPEAEPSGPGRATPGRDPSLPAVSAVVNPLAGFLAGWMTPHDYALLQAPAAKAAGADPTGWSQPAPGGGTSPPGAAGGLAGWGGLELAGNRAGPEAGRAPNPFWPGEDLVKISPPAAPAKSLAPPPPALPGVAPRGNPAAPAPLARPDLSQPSEDETYFKGLRRF